MKKYVRVTLLFVFCASLLTGCGSPAAEESTRSVPSPPRPTPALPAPLPPEEVPEHTLEPADSPEPAAPLTAEDYEAALPAPQPLPMTPDQQCYRSANRVTICDNDGAVYLVSVEREEYTEALYRWKDGKSQCLYAPGGWVGDGLFGAGDRVYIGGVSLPVTGGAAEPALSLWDRQAVGRTVFMGFSPLTAFSLDAPDEVVTIWGHSNDESGIKLGGYSASEEGVAFTLYSGDPNGPDRVTRLYFHAADGTRRLLDETMDVSFPAYYDMRLYRGYVYYWINETDTLYRINIETGEKSRCLSLDDSHEISCAFYGDAVYIMAEGGHGWTFLKAAPDGGGREILAQYKDIERTMDLAATSPFRILPAEDCIYLEGLSMIRGGALTVRIPLSGKDRDAEIFLEGKWLTPDGYEEEFPELAGRA